MFETLRLHIRFGCALLVATSCRGSGSGAGVEDAGATGIPYSCMSAGLGLCECNGGVQTTSGTCGPSDVDVGYGSVCAFYAPGPTCACGGFSCSVFSTFCQCGWVGLAGGPSAASCTGTYCCSANGQATPGVCACGDTPCESGDTQVSECNEANTPTTGSEITLGDKCQ
jgi:hypothetical protein